MSIDKLTQAVKELHELKQAQKEIDKRVKELDELVKSELERRDKEELLLKGYNVAVKSVTRNGIDTTRLKDEAMEIYTRFLKATVYKTLSIKEV